MIFIHIFTTQDINQNDEKNLINAKYLHNDSIYEMRFLFYI